MKTKFTLVLMLILSINILSANAYFGIVPGSKYGKTKELSNESFGIQIYEVKDNTPAADAGLKKNDILLKFDGEKVYTSDQFYKMLSLKEAGDKVKILIERNGKKITKKITLADKKKFGKPYLGIFPTRLTDDIKSEKKYDKNYGIYLNKIVKDGPSDKAGISEETILMKLDDDKIFTVDQLLMMLKNYKVDQKVKLTCFVDGVEKTFDVKLGSNPNKEFLSGGIDFFDHPNNIFLYKFPNEFADSLGGKTFEMFFNGEELKLPGFNGMRFDFNDMSDFFDDFNFDNIDFKDLDEMEIYLNGKKLKLPDDIQKLNPEKLEEKIREQIGDDEEEKSIEIKIIKNENDEE